MQEAAAIRIFLEKYRDFDFIHTPKGEPADIDGFITDETTLISGVEIKCRMMTCDQLFHDYKGRWLITYDKIERGISICRSLGVDFRGFLYLVPDETLLIVKIWDHRTHETVDMDLEETRTQATVNGGSIVRLNAYISIAGATVVCPKG